MFYIIVNSTDNTKWKSKIHKFTYTLITANVFKKQCSEIKRKKYTSMSGVIASR